MDAGDTLGKYQIVERLARGGMAEVWLARFQGVGGFEKDVVLKTILPNLAEDPDFVTMFINEALLAAKLNHPNIVQIFDLGCLDNNYFIAMELVPGKSLRQIARRLREEGQLIPIWFLLRVASAACEGLQYAHHYHGIDGKPMNLVHRDVSPENVMVSFTGTAKILDFGIAKAATAASVTRAGMLKGKYSYISPEQVRGVPADRKSDIYSLGVLLYELLSGTRPFAATNDLDLLRQVVEGSPAPLAETAPWVPVELRQIVSKAMAPDASSRFQEAEQLGEELTKYLNAIGDVHGQRDLAVYLSSLFPWERSIPGAILKSVDGPPAVVPTPSQVSIDTGDIIEIESTPSHLPREASVTRPLASPVVAPERSATRPRARPVEGQADERKTEPYGSIQPPLDVPDEPRKPRLKTRTEASRPPSATAAGAVETEARIAAPDGKTAIPAAPQSPTPDAPARPEPKAVARHGALPGPRTRPPQTPPPQLAPAAPSAVEPPPAAPARAESPPDKEASPARQAKPARASFAATLPRPRTNPKRGPQAEQPAVVASARDTEHPRPARGQDRPQPAGAAPPREVKQPPAPAPVPRTRSRRELHDRPPAVRTGGPAAQSSAATPTAGQEAHAGVTQPPGAIEARREADMASPAGIPTRPGRTSNFFTARRPALPEDVDIFTSFRQIGSQLPARQAEKQPERREAPDDSPAHHFERGLLLLRKGQYSEALASWEAAASLDPENRLYQTNIRRLKKLIAAV